jgi:hypothetical protein
LPKSIVWAAVAFLSVVAIFGFLHENLFAQELWKNGGLERLAAFTIGFWMVAGALLWIRPTWLMPAMAAFALLYSEWWCWQFSDPVAPVAVLYFLGSCFCLGSAVARRASAVARLLVGLAIWMLILSVAVHFPVNRPWVYAIAFAVPYFALRRERIEMPSSGFGSSALIYVLLLHLMVVLKPEAGTDALAMHLAIPDMIAREGKFAFDVQHYAWSVMPMGGDFLFAGVYLLGGETAARLLNFAALALIVTIVYRCSRRWLAPGHAAMAAALFASTPLVQLVTGSLFVENIWTALLAGGVMLLWEGETVWSAMLFGAAFAVKAGTSAFLVPAMAITLVRSRERRLWAALAMLVVFAAPPYLNAWIKTGNPVFPFANNVFHSRFFDTTTPLKDVRYQQPGALDALYNLTFRSSEFLESQNGALGFQYFVLLLPMMLLLNRKAPIIPVLAGIAGAILTFASLPNLRYLYPALPMISIGIAWMIAEIPRLIPAVIALITLNIWFLPASGWYHNEFALFTQNQIDDYVKFAAPERKLVDVANRMAPGEPVAIFQIPAIAGLRARAYVDTWHTFQFWKALTGATSPAQIATLCRDLRIRYLITPIPPETDHVIVAQFIETWTAPTGKESGRFQLRTLLTEPVAQPRETNPAGPGTYDDLDPRIEYTGSWLHDRQFEKTFARSITYSNQPGDSARFFFSGTSITYVYTMAFNRGGVEVSIDREARGRIDLYSKEIRWQQRTVFSGLASGPHTIELRVADWKNPKSSGRFVDLDRFVAAR